ncbi:hypothetical protein DSM104635_00186 [Terricaulis silvestris]|uniref:Uncharacterized protein n=1 Tax=Terricaulis silvestris TaxID=2686094 RepID=A0A6I6MJW7_9CAUL|nr:hypothetical protein DSM104635_00186 [Terricaulis silvestris]
MSLNPMAGKARRPRQVRQAVARWRGSGSAPLGGALPLDREYDAKAFSSERRSVRWFIGKMRQGAAQ